MLSPSKMIRILLPALALLAETCLAVPSPAARAEIDHLLVYLEQSDCDFFRNGKWYPAVQARNHLQRKYEYLLDKDLVDTAEQFIERAASGSSRSGKIYLVRCARAAPVASGDWLTEELRRHREPGGQ